MAYVLHYFLYLCRWDFAILMVDTDTFNKLWSFWNMLPASSCIVLKILREFY